MTVNWEKFIQVNIYGRTLQELHKEGVTLEAVLNDIGCSKVWIVEGSMCGRESLRNCNESILSEPEPVLSTTTANLPRFSTPITSRHFTMNFTTNISRINSNEEELCEKSDSSGTIEYCHSDVFHDCSEDDQLVIRNILNELLDGVEMEEQNANTGEASQCESTLPITETKRQERKIDPSSRTLSLRSDAKKTNKCRRRQSAPILKFEAFSDESDEEQKNKSQTLKRRSPRSDGHKKKVIVDDDRTLNSLLSDSDSKFTDALYETKERNEAPNEVTSDPQSSSPCQLKPISSMDWNSPINYSYSGETSSYQDVSEIDEFYTFHDGDDINDDETLDMQTFTPPPPNVLPSASILKTGGSKTTGQKTVSFKNQRKGDRKGAEGKKRILGYNELHNVKCGFPNCDKVISWKRKYGKLRLIDHVLLHATDKLITCRHCQFSTRTVRQMRYHYERKHGEKKLIGFGMLNVFSLPLGNMDFRDLWKSCFQDSLDLVGNISKERKWRRKENKKDKKAPEASEENDEDVESDGNAFF